MSPMTFGSMTRLVIATAVGLALQVGPIPVARAASTARVPVVVCPTTLGINSAQTPVASSALVPASAAHLAVYSATSGYIQILGPKHLACQAGIGADGTSSITAEPPYSHNQDIGHGGVAAVVYPACAGCILTLTCPYFTAARKAALQDHFSCPVQPLGQMIHRLSSIAVAFSDPPGEYVPPHSGSMVPSNSPYPTNGIVVYDSYLYKGRYPNTSGMEAVCVLPANEHAICTAVLDEFLATQVRDITRQSGP